MDRFEDQEQWVDDQVEIIDLDTEDDAARKRPSSKILTLLQRIHIAPRARARMLALMVSGSLVGLLLIVQPGLFSFLRNSSAAPPTPTVTLPKSPTVPPFSPFIIQTTASNEAVYLNMPNGAINARRASDGDLLWYRAPSLSSDRVLVATDTVLYSSSNYGGRGVIEAFEAKDGILLWRHQTSISGPHTLRVLDGIVYVNMRGNVRALRASDGTVLWQFRAVQSRNVSAVVYVQGGIAAVNTSSGIIYVLQASDGKQLFSYRKVSGEWRPYIEEDIIYVHTEENVLKAISINDGKLLWQQAFNQHAPLVWKAGNGIVYANAGDGQLRALRGRDGTLLWQYPSTGAEIIVEKQALYIITIDGFFTALQANTGSQIWRKEIGRTFNRVQAVDDILFFGEGEHSIIAWRASDGKQIWSYSSHIPIVWYPKTAGGQLYILKTNRTMLDALRLDTGEVLWRYPGSRSIT